MTYITTDLYETTREIVNFSKNIQRPMSSKRKDYSHRSA